MLIVFKKSAPKNPIVCAHCKFQGQSLLSVVAHHQISLCSGVFVFAKQKLGSELGRNSETEKGEGKSRERRRGLSLEPGAEGGKAGEGRRRTQARQAGAPVGRLWTWGRGRPG